MLAKRHVSSFSDTADPAGSTAGGPSLTRRGLLGLAGTAAIVAAAPAALADGARFDVETIRLIELVNSVRSRYGLSPLSAEERLMNAAQAHADDLAWQAMRAQLATYGHGPHRGSDGSLPADRVRRFGYNFRIVGENVAAGRAVPEFTVADWIESDGHFRTMTDSRVRQAGAGYAFNPRDQQFQYYWVLVVAG
ncbi:MAG: CAP domain-containing protein [Alphaproteobacteria bacterium]